jgi:hypothetical protein
MPSASRASAVLAIPAPASGDLARLVYSSPTDPQEVDATIPANGPGYSVEIGCTATAAKKSVGFQVLDGESMVVSGSIVCNGENIVDTAVAAGAPAQSVHLVLTGADPSVTSAYLILAPSPGA